MDAAVAQSNDSLGRRTGLDVLGIMVVSQKKAVKNKVLFLPPLHDFTLMEEERS